MNEFNLGSDALEGINVLEASAGTGKTFTIAGLYLRLLLERHMDVENVLVVTFTEAATAELNQRIRDTLKTALRAFMEKAAGIAVDGPAYPAPIPSLLASVDATEAVDALTHNLRTFDEASIYTIHGFCRTLLLENSFESGTQFGCELETDQQSLIESVVADYWRATIGGASPLVAKALAGPGAGLDIASLTFLVKQAMDHLDVTIVPDAPASRTEALSTQYAAAVETASRAWKRGRVAIEQLLAGSTQLNQRQYSAEKVRMKMEAADVYFSHAPEAGLFPDELTLFTQSNIGNCVKKNCTAPAHPFFALCDAVSMASAGLEEAIAGDVLAVKRNVFAYAASHLADRKRELNILSFNDLLLTTRDAVCSPNADVLIEKLRSRYSAVLIDEFQDTDPVQYTIFSRLFGDGTTVLFYIGDPKQAIYGFRGADVFAYMTATSQRDIRKATLAMNYRSTKGLICAVNTLFQRAHDPFIFEGIEFSPVSYPEEKQHSRLVIGGNEAVPMTIVYRPYVKPEGGRSKNALNKERSAEEAIALTVDAVVKQLMLGKQVDTYFETGDKKEKLDENAIAVLVRTNRQAGKMQEALRAAGVFSVIHSNESIFASREAVEVLRVMSAAAEPASAPLLRSALITSLLGVTAEELDSLNTDGVSMGRRHEHFMALNVQWKRNGFIEMFSRLLEQEHVLSRLLAMPEGERRAANLLQLSELLQKTESGDQLSPQALVTWFEKKIAAGDKEDEEYVENLATDQKAVKIVTVHSSKGLQYKIVYCPFLWEVPMPGANTPDPAVFFHAPQAETGVANRLVYDIGSTDLAAHSEVFQREMLAEQTRVAYVALTRAEYQCHILYGNFSSTERSAIGYLLHGTADPDELSAILADEGKVFADLNPLADDADGNIFVARAGDAEGLIVTPEEDRTAQSVPIAALARTRTIDAAGTVASFTSLAQHTGSDRRRLYVDEIQSAEAVTGTAGERTIFTFAKGKLAGDFFHEVFEKIDFDMSDAESVIAARMKKYGLDASEEPAAREAVRNVLHKKLTQVAPSFSLSLLGKADRRHETNFYFPLTPFAKRHLRKFMNEYTNADDRMANNEYADGRVKGWLNGKIDLLFRHGGKYYIVDWKSNYLGGTREAYAPERLREAMVRDDYFLQSLLYTIGTDRYLRDRLPGYTYDAQFGGVIYIFLRGVDAAAEDECGIFFEKPDAEKIRRLAALIAAPMPSDTELEEDHG